MKNGTLSKEIKRLAAAFGHAGAGLKAASVHPAFRIELLVTLVMAPAAFWLSENNIERILMIGSLMLVLIVELLNTAIEAAIDRISSEWHPLSKRAKDLGSAAVLMSILNAGILWLIILLP